ncbi:uncharacterized protein LOC106084789 [Stomoxys calcitrans]|uniref:uncharacterized protein LOC106084789 n=1 Tax=Stomoxys calcitrans TaxID=35570 RepID=UPI0027E320A7|nr:uncharacterized protein LOC106084789 [Stomoxys calcitrans]
MLKHPPTSNYCRLCVKRCSDYQRSLYDGTGQANANRHLVGQYFTNAVLNMEWEQQLQYICEECWQNISRFHQFQQSVIEEQKSLQLKEVGEVKIKPEENINQQEIQLEFHNAKEFSARTEDVMKPTVLTFDIKSEEPLDLNCEYEGQLTDKEMSLMSHMSNRNETTSLLNDDESNDGFSSSDDMAISSLDQTNPCSSDKEDPATKKSVKEFDELVALWRSSLECEICHQLVASYSQLEGHFRKDHASEVCYLMCCQLKLDNLYNIEKHIRYHSAPQQLRCEACCKVFRLKKYLRRHKIYFHTSKGGDENAKDSKMLERKYRCDKCWKTFATKKHLTGHDRYMHKSETLDCDICEKSFNRPYLLREHLATSHKGEKRHACPVCPEAFTQRNSFCRHMRTSHPQEWKRMKNESALSETIKGYRRETRGESTVYVCIHCSKEYDKRCAMFSHVKRLHKRTTQQLADANGSTIPTRKKKAHACSFCPKAYSSRFCFSQHMRKCHPQEWKKMQNEEDALKGYRRETRGESIVYVCIYCSKEYENRNSMNSHLYRCQRDHRPIEPKKGFRQETRGESMVFVCIYCPKEYKNQRLMYNHLNRCHKDNGPLAEQAAIISETPVSAEQQQSIHSRSTRICQDLHHSRIIEPKKTDVTNSATVGDTLNELTKQGDDKDFTETNVWGNEEMDESEIPPEFEDATSEKVMPKVRDMLKQPPPSDYCRLCVKSCNDYQRSLYDEAGQANANHELVGKYFTTAMLNMEWEGHLQYICGTCWQHIWNFHQFQQSIIETQKEATKEIEEVVKVKSEMNIKEEQLESHNALSHSTDDLVKPNEEQLEWQNAQGFTASKKDLVKPTALTFVIKSEEPLDFNSDYEGMSPQEGQQQLAYEEMSVKSHMTSGQDTSLLYDDETNEDYSSNDELPSTSLEQINNICSPYKKFTATKKSIEEFDELVALWRSHLECEICHHLLASYSQLEEHFSENHTSVICYLMCCQLRLETRYDIEKHIHYHNAPQHLKCEACCKVFRLLKYLRSHKRNVHTSKAKDKNAKDSEMLEEKYRCDKCPKAFATKKYLTKHQSDVHKPKSFECEICGKSFSRQNVMREHLASHIGEKTHACSFCPKAFTSRAYFCRHMRTTHPQEWQKMQNEVPPRETMKGYRRETRGENIVYVCLHCSKECDKQTSMYYHLGRCQSQDKPVELKKGFRLETRGGSEVYVCIYCSKVCDKPTSMYHRSKRCLKAANAKSVEQAKDSQTTLDSLKLGEIMSTYKCPICLKLYGTKLMLHSHIRRMHQNSSASINLQALNSIKQEVEEQDKDNDLNEPANKLLLFNYLIEPTSKGAFRCKICSQEYESKHSLGNHIMSEHPTITKLEQESMATVTSMKYEETEDMANIPLKDHVIRMDSFKRSLSVVYKCNLCPKTYEKKQNMSAHLRRTHKQSVLPQSIITKFQVQGKGTEDAPRTKFRCELCSKVYEQQRSIFSHVKKIHKRTTQPLDEANDPTYTKIMASVNVPNVEIAAKTSEGTVTSQPLYKCPFCPMQYKTNGSLYGHTRRNHKNKIATNKQKELRFSNFCERSPNGGLRCKICSKVYGKKCTLYAHIRRVHRHMTTKGRQVVEEKPANTTTITSVLYRCKFCTKAYDKIYLLNAHLRRTHKKNSKHESFYIKYKVGSENPPHTKYKCKLCFKEYDNRYSIYSHVRMIHNQDSLYIRIIVTKKTDETSIASDDDTLNVLDKTEEHSLMTPIEVKELKDENATTSTCVKTRIFS